MSRIVARMAAPLLAFALAPFAAPAGDASSVPAPALKAGDSWVFDQTLQKGQNGFGQARLDLTIERLDGDTILVGIKRDGAPTAFEDHRLGPDWSQRRIVDGQETVTTRPFNFPMAVGQTWTTDYVDATRRGNQLSAHIHCTYTVTGWEDVTVPAGTFRALKVVAKGVNKGAILVPTTAMTGAAVAGGATAGVTRTQRGGVGELTRRTYAELYYIPQIKIYGKSVEEQYTTDDVLSSRDTKVLVSYKLAP